MIYSFLNFSNRVIAKFESLENAILLEKEINTGCEEGEGSSGYQEDDYWYWYTFLHVLVTYPSSLWLKPLGPLYFEGFSNEGRSRQGTTTNAYCHGVGRKYFNNILSTVTPPFFYTHLGLKMITPCRNSDIHTHYQILWFQSKTKWSLISWHTPPPSYPFLCWPPTAEVIRSLLYFITWLYLSKCCFKKYMPAVFKSFCIPVKTFV